MKVLIVDDSKIARLNIRSQLDENLSVLEAATFEEGLLKIRNFKFDICYIDLRLDNSSKLRGLELVEEAVKKGFYTVVMTSIEDEKVIEEAYELGCQDVYIKGNEKEHVYETIGRFLLSKERFVEDHFLKDSVPTQNKKYKEDLKKLLKMIPTELPICILGESGTGKSHLARAIHETSRRKGQFIEINCATFSGDTLKSELFGHVKGSFTGAIGDKQGKLQEAHNGTLFLDEIGSMSLEMQEGLLKALEEKSFYPLGSNKLVKSDFRIICATLDDLEILIKSGKFRFDLFQRISGYTFTQPPLRGRREDIFPILKNKLSLSRKIVFKEEAKLAIESYQWPGNIRELLRFGEILTASGVGVVKLDDIQSFIKSSGTKKTAGIVHEEQFELIKMIGLKAFIDQFMAEAIRMGLEINDNKIRATIKQLRIPNHTFYKYTSSNFDPINFKHSKNKEEIHELH